MWLKIDWSISVHFTNSHQIHPLLTGLLDAANSVYTGPAYTELNKISVTTLLKPLKVILLNRKFPDTGISDYSGYFSAGVGTSVHKLLQESLQNNPVWLSEVRSEIEIDGFILSGSADAINTSDHSIHDLKTSSVYTYQKLKEDLLKLSNGHDISLLPTLFDYSFQLSAYKLLNPTLIKSDIGFIHFIFTDWQRNKAKFDTKYPPIMAATVEIPLFDPLPYIKDKLFAIRMVESGRWLFPSCTATDTWNWVRCDKYCSVSHICDQKAKDYL